MKLALHRSLTFWAGILLAISIIWLWRGTLASATTARKIWHGVLAYNDQGVELAWDPVLGRPMTSQVWTLVFLPYPMLLLILAALWCGMLVWRARRRKRQLLEDPVRPTFHRSIIFWAGVFVMGFVCWAWWDSTRAVHWGGYGDWLFASTESRVSLGQVRIGQRGWFSLPLDWDASHEMRLSAPRLLRHLGGDFWSEVDPVQIDGVTQELDPDELWLFHGKKGDWQLFLPHWLILLAVTLVWFALLFWRARRRAASIKEVGE